MFLYDVEAIVECGELVRRSLVAGYEVGESLPGDLSED
jgi:hypothetical protein